MDLNNKHRKKIVYKKNIRKKKSKCKKRDNMKQERSEPYLLFGASHSCNFLKIEKHVELSSV